MASLERLDMDCTTPPYFQTFNQANALHISDTVIRKTDIIPAKPHSQTVGRKSYGVIKLEEALA